MTVRERTKEFRRRYERAKRTAEALRKLPGIEPWGLDHVAGLGTFDVTVDLRGIKSLARIVRTVQRAGGRIVIETVFPPVTVGPYTLNRRPVKTFAQSCRIVGADLDGVALGLAGL